MRGGGERAREGVVSVSRVLVRAYVERMAGPCKLGKLRVEKVN